MQTVFDCAAQDVNQEDFGDAVMTAYRYFEENYYEMTLSNANKTRVHILVLTKYNADDDGVLYVVLPERADVSYDQNIQLLEAIHYSYYAYNDNGRKGVAN